MAKLKDRYANALLEISEARDSLETDIEQSALICTTLESAEIQAFLTHPHISTSEKQQFFQNAFSDKLADHLMGFLYLMIRKSREALIVPALREYMTRANRRLGKIEAKVVSAKPLKENQIESIRLLLSKQTNLEVDLKAVSDPDVIGGFYILLDGYIFDGTVRSQLNNMREQLKRGGFQ